jgi:hypothetical protein
MRVYLGTTADEVRDFLNDLILDIPDVYAPTPQFEEDNPDMDAEEIEFALSLLAAEDALDLVDETTGLALVLAFEVDEEDLGEFDELSALVSRPLRWSEVEAVFTVGDGEDELTWYAPQEVASLIEEWLKG